MELVKEELAGSIVNQKDEVNEDFSGMWKEMMAEFEDLSQQMRDDMNTVRKEFSDVNSDVKTFGSSMKESFNNA